MRKLRSFYILALLICIAGVSCSNEMPRTVCKLNTSGKGLEPNVTYQYYVEKDNGVGSGKICDWTVFDVSKGLTLEGLAKGGYTFRVRGISPKGDIMYSGQTSATLLGNTDNDITIVLYPVSDTAERSSLLINLLDSASGDLSASVSVKNREGGKPISTAMSKSGTDFSFLAESLSSGFYDVSAFVYREGVVVGGEYRCVFVPNGYDKTVSMSITPRPTGTLTDIETCGSQLKLAKDEEVTLAWPCDGSLYGPGTWMLDGKAVESSTFYFRLPTSSNSSYKLEYHNGDFTKSIDVNVGGPSTRVSILNFRSATKIKVCTGYKYAGTDEMIPLTPFDIEGEFSNIKDYAALGLTAVLGSSMDGASFVEMKSVDALSGMFSSSGKTTNDTVKTVIVDGNITGSNMGKLTALETLVVDGGTSINMNSVKNQKNLKTVYIIPPATGYITVSQKAFDGCTALEHFYVIGSAEQIYLEDGCFTGTPLIKTDVRYLSSIPL